MPSGHAYAKAVRTVKTCVGTDFCRFGLGDAMGVGIELERAMEGLYTPHKVKSAVTGCPRNCAEAYVKDIGLVAVEGGWELYVGGAAGATVRKGDLLDDRAHLRRGDPASRSPSCSTTASPRSTSSAPTPTSSGSGIEPVREAVLDHIDELLERYRIAKAAADPDPWRERHAPVHPRQFAELDVMTARGPCRDRNHLDPRRPRRGHPAARGPQHERRRPPDRDLPPARRLRRDRRPLPARRRPAGRRDRRRLVRHLPAARPPLRPGRPARRSTGRRRSPSTRSA